MLYQTSEEEFEEGIILDRRGMEFFYSTLIALKKNGNALIGSAGEYKVDPKSKLISPLLCPGGHKTQPPTYLQVCG